jgi:hypothetical protein
MPKYSLSPSHIYLFFSLHTCIHIDNKRQNVMKRGRRQIHRLLRRKKEEKRGHDRTVSI